MKLKSDEGGGVTINAANYFEIRGTKSVLKGGFKIKSHEGNMKIKFFFINVDFTCLLLKQ